MGELERAAGRWVSDLSTQRISFRYGLGASPDAIDPRSDSSTRKKLYQRRDTEQPGCPSGQKQELNRREAYLYGLEGGRKLAV